MQTQRNRSHGVRVITSERMTLWIFLHFLRTAPISFLFVCFCLCGRISLSLPCACHCVDARSFFPVLLYFSFHFILFSCIFSMRALWALTEIWNLHQVSFFGFALAKCALCAIFFCMCWFGLGANQQWERNLTHELFHFLQMTLGSGMMCSRIVRVNRCCWKKDEEATQLKNVNKNSSDVDNDTDRPTDDDDDDRTKRMIHLSKN